MIDEGRRKGEEYSRVDSTMSMAALITNGTGMALSPASLTFCKAGAGENR